MLAVVLNVSPDSLSKETLMIDLNVLSSPAQPQQTVPIEQGLEACREHFNHLLSEVLHAPHQEAHLVEASIFKQLMQLGLLLLHLFFVNHQQGDYGPTLQTAQGLATRGRPSERSYFSIFGKLQVKRYLYSVGSMSFAPLDQFLNLPVRCYSYFLAERVNLLNIHCTGQKIRIADIVDKYDVLVPSAHSIAVSRLRVVPLACLGDLTGCFGYDQIHSEKRSWLDVDAF